MSLTREEILNDFQKLINHKVAKRESVEPELYNALGLLQDFMHPIEGSGSGLNDTSNNSVNNLYSDCKVLIDRTEFQTDVLNIISDADCSGELNSYIQSLTDTTDRQSFISGMVYASLLTSKLPTFIFKQVNIAGGNSELS